MSELTPRSRMFAGPNGSGKSTLKTLLPSELLTRYINPDEIEAAILERGCFDFESWQVATDAAELHDFFAASTLLEKADLRAQAATLPFRNGKIFLARGQVNSYFASVLADFVRRKLVANRRSFTFETVMSSPDKIEFLDVAKRSGFRVYLYFVATSNPKINLSRVANRVRAGGHDVPPDKILARYERSLQLLSDAIQAADRAYIFDNSGPKLDWLAEFEHGQILELKTASPPRWFQTHALQKL